MTWGSTSHSRGFGKTKALYLLLRNPCCCTGLLAAWGPTPPITSGCSLGPSCKDPGSVCPSDVGAMVWSYCGLPGGRLSWAARAIFYWIIQTASLRFHLRPAVTQTFFPAAFQKLLLSSSAHGLGLDIKLIWAQERVWCTILIYPSSSCGQQVSYDCIHSPEF